MKLTIELGRLSASVNIPDDKKAEEILTIYATYHGRVQNGMNRRQVLRAALRQMLSDARQQAVIQREGELRKSAKSQAEEAISMEIIDDESEA